MIKFSASLLITLLFITNFAESDRSKMALFDLKPMQNGEYHLKAVFNRNNMMRVLTKENTTLKAVDVSASLQTYLNQHIAFQFDEEPVEVEWKQSRTGEQFISIEATLFATVTAPRNIRITNTCLVDDVAQHANLIRIYLHNKKRIFKLDVHRKSTLVQYREVNPIE